MGRLSFISFQKLILSPSEKETCIIPAYTQSK